MEKERGKERNRRNTYKENNMGNRRAYCIVGSGLAEAGVTVTQI